MRDQETAENCEGSKQVQVEGGVMPPELLDLVRFLANTWTAIDEFVYENCDPEKMGKYPVVQGTRNQIDLINIGKQPYNTANIRAAVNYMLGA